MNVSFKLGIAATLSLASLGLMSGCKNTAEGVAEDSANAQKVAAESAEKTGEKMSQAAENATKSTEKMGQDVAGALQVTPLVKTAITADTELNDAKNTIDVDSKDGMVYLKGHVTSNALKAKATKIAQERIKENNGTDKVVNQLLVKP